jgi:hypothetical protein
MKAKTRKIIKRVGAGFMLGISLIGIGTSWNKTDAQVAHKRVRNLRKKDQEKLNKEDQILLNIAEEEAKGVISEQQKQKQEQHQLEESLSFNMQRFFRFGVAVVWAAIAGLFLFSLFFNQPFSLGKGVLSILPGNPHPAVLVLEASKKNYNLGEKIEIDLNLDTKKEAVEVLKIFITYDDERLSFVKSQIKNKKLSGSFREGQGEIELTLNLSEGKSSFSKEDVATLFFESKSASLEDKNKVSVVQEKTRIFNGGNNILGKIDSANFYVKN